MSDDGRGSPTGAADRSDGGGHRWPLGRAETWALSAGLVVVAAVRLVPLRDVVRGGDVVLSSNDPYFYRYLVDRVTERAGSPLDVGAFLDLPGRAETGEPLLVASLGFVSELLGGGPTATGVVVAVYPVVTAVLTGVLVYALARRLSGDARIALAALGLFAVVPGHAFRTGVGFADHHAFDYLWLTLTAFALVACLDADRPSSATGRRRWLAPVLLGVGVAGQTLAWEAAPLLLVPVAIGVAVAGPVLARAGRPSALRPAAIGLGGATAVVLPVHALAGWQDTVVAAVPALLLVGTAGVFATAWAVDRLGRSWVAVPAVELAGGGLAALVVALGAPSVVAAGARGLDHLFGDAGIAEMTALGSGFGVVVDPMVMLGFAGFLGMPVALWAVARSVRSGDPGWLVVAVYATFFLGLSFAQRRFTGELAPFVGVLAGVGFVALLSWLDLVRPAGLRDGRRSESRTAANGGTPTDAVRTVRRPGRRRFLALGGVSLLFAGFPALYTSHFHRAVTPGREAVRAARWMAAYADDRGWSWPETYVLSSWGVNRMYNYVVSGHARSYAFAKRTYWDFVLSHDAADWYERLRDRVGFVVVEGMAADLSPWSLYRRLFHAHGSATERVPGVGHYRAVYVGDGGSPAVFTLVEGALVRGRAPAGDSGSDSDSDPGVASDGGDLVVATDVSIPGASFTYERRVEPRDDGTFSVRVAHPGEYRVGDDRTVTVPERAVRDGNAVDVR